MSKINGGSSYFDFFKQIDLDDEDDEDYNYIEDKLENEEYQFDNFPYNHNIPKKEINDLLQDNVE